ncbi:MAG TPA: short-chain dehydrogenase, partial [Dehalococcoidia bacterium]|nr:short-chain dehydrogenase [Dehalococcoidia bacterium]
KITIGDINAAEGDSAVAQIRDAGGEAWFHQTDVSKDADVRSLMETAERDMGGINSLVSAAAIARD